MPGESEKLQNYTVKHEESQSEAILGLHVVANDFVRDEVMAERVRQFEMVCSKLTGPRHEKITRVRDHYDRIFRRSTRVAVMNVQTTCFLVLFLIRPAGLQAQLEETDGPHIRLVLI